MSTIRGRKRLQIFSDCIGTRTNVASCKAALVNSTLHLSNVRVYCLCEHLESVLFRVMKCVFARSSTIGILDTTFSDGDSLKSFYQDQTHRS